MNGIISGTALHKTTNSKIVAWCKECRSKSLPQSSHEVVLRSLNWMFNQIICIDHMYLGDQCVVREIDTKTSFSAGVVVIDTSLSDSIYSLHVCWLTPILSPEAIRDDGAFMNNLLTDFTRYIGVKFESEPPHRHQRNVLVSKHCILRSMFLRLFVLMSLQTKRFLLL